MPSDPTVLDTDDLACLLLVGAAGRLSVADLRVFLGPCRCDVVDRLLEAGWLTREPSIGTDQPLVSALPAPVVVDTLRERGPDAEEAGNAALADLRAWMAEQFRIDVVIRLIPWIPADEEGVRYLLDHGRPACSRDPDAVLTALGHVTRAHPVPLCPALRSVLALALDAVGRHEEAVTCAARALDTNEPASACAHALTPEDGASLALWLAQRRAQSVEDALTAAEHLRSTSPVPAPIHRSRPASEIDILIELFFAQCWSTDLTDARRSLWTLCELAELVGSPHLAGAILALRAYYSCLAGDLVVATRHALAALASQPLDPRSAHVVHTVLAWTALSDADPAVEAHARAAEALPVQPVSESGFLATARALGLAQTYGPDAARDAIRSDLELLPPHSPAARVLRLTSLADLAWASGDTRELRTLERSLAELTGEGETAMVRARLQVGRRDGDTVLRQATRLARRSTLPFTSLRVTHAAAEHLWVTGRIRDADRMLARAVETGERRRAVRFTRDMFLRRPDWAERVAKTLATTDTPRPRWLPIDLTGHVEPQPVTIADHILAAGRRESPLSPAEMRVLDAMAAGLTATQTADRLFLSPHTVRTHHKAIYRKLGVHKRADAIAVGRERGWF